MLRKVIGGLTGLALLALAGPANATLITDTVDCDVQPNNFWSCDPTQAVVGGGVEFQLDLVGSPFFDIDIGASSFSMTSLENLFAGAGEVVTISSLDWVDNPSGILVDIDNFFTDANSGVDSSDVTVGDHSIVFDFNDTEWRVGQVVSFDLVTDHDVPEPSTLALFAIALGGLGFMMRRRVA